MSDVDERVAREVMGWKSSPKGMAWWAKDGTAPYSTNGTITNRKVWRPSTNIAHAFEMEDRIDELGLKSKYVEALTEGIEDDFADCFDFLHADPNDRCKAALKAKGKP